MKRVLLLLLSVPALAAPAPAFGWGGTYPTGDSLGTSIRIDVSDTIPVDQSLPQAWATFLGSLVHGPELASLSLRLAPPTEIARICGAGSLACYSRKTQTIVAAPDDVTGGPTAREIVIHEYAHHIAAHRTNAPWSASAWGTKRWASYMGICRDVAAGWAIPGDEGSDYSLNPGEAFAESYRVLNLHLEGVYPVSWDLVDRRFHPDATALSLLQQDVLTPWTGPTTTHVRGSFGGGAFRTIDLQTPLDGSLAVHLHGPAPMRLALRSGATLIGTGRSIAFRICGERRLTLQVERLRAHGSFTVDITKP